MKKHIVSTVAGLLLFAWTTLLAADLNVWELDINFCGAWNKLAIIMDANTSTGICMNLTNLSSKPWTVWLSFVDGEMSQWESPVQACKTSSAGIFWQSTRLSWDSIFTIKPNEVIQKTATVTLPTGYAGNLYGCITYTILEGNSAGASSGQMFSVVSRKANTISIVVSGTVVSDLQLVQLWTTLGDNPFLHIERNGDGTYTLTVKVINNGTASENMAGIITIDDWLFYQKEFVLTKDVQVYPQEEKEFKIELGKMPIYGGSFDINLSLSHTPVTVDGKPAGGTNKMNQQSLYVFGALQYWLLPLLGSIFWVLVILFFIERPLVKKWKAKRAKRKAEKKAAKEAKKKHHNNEE